MLQQHTFTWGGGGGVVYLTSPLSVTAIEAALSGQIKINMGCWLPADTLQ